MRNPKEKQMSISPEQQRRNATRLDVTRSPVEVQVHILHLAKVREQVHQVFLRCFLVNIRDDDNPSFDGCAKEGAMSANDRDNGDLQQSSIELLTSRCVATAGGVCLHGVVFHRISCVCTHVKQAKQSVHCPMIRMVKQWSRGDRQKLVSE